MTDYYYHTQEILEVANNAYHSGEGRIAESIADSARGDTLATFIRREIRDVTYQEEDKRYALMLTDMAIQKAIDELTSVREAITSELMA